jgi:hypothetical protein
MRPVTAVTLRDMHCVGCDADPARRSCEEHHRRPGDTSDNRPSAKVLVCGFGNNLRDADGRWWCHGRAHQRREAFGDPRGLIVSRHGTAGTTLLRPVFYYQPSLARVGWYLLDDDGGLTGPLDQPWPDLSPEVS